MRGKWRKELKEVPSENEEITFSLATCKQKKFLQMEKSIKCSLDFFVLLGQAKRTGIRTQGFAVKENTLEI
jgi:hypothetical protein